MTKKLSKKLISIFLSLLMVLSLIPTGMITAFAAATVGDCYFCGHSLSSHKTTGDLVIVGDTQVISSCSDCGGQSECVGKTWALAIEGDDNPMNNPEAHECSYTTSTHYMITTNGSNFRCKQYAYDSTREKWFVDSKLKSIANAKFPEGASAGDGKFYIENPDSAGTYIECADDYVDFTTTHYFCGFCQDFYSSSFISNDNSDVAEHIWTAHDGDMSDVLIYTRECGDEEYLCGDPECPNTPTGPDTSSWPTSYVHDDCQHSGVVHFYATGVRYGNNNGDVEGRMFYDSTSYDDMYDGSSMTTLASAFETNGAEIEGWYYWDGGFYPCSAPAGPTTPEWLDTIVSKVDAVVDELAHEDSGETFLLSQSLEELNASTFAELVDSLTNKEYSQADNVYTIEGNWNTEKMCINVTLDADENVASVNATLADNEGVYTDLTFTPAPTTPEWVATIVSKVDASADKLVNSKGETYAEVSSKNGGISGTIALLTNPVYTNEGYVYTIRGYLGASIINEGEVVVTLDSNGDVASLAVNAYVSGSQVNSLTYTPASAGNLCPDFSAYDDTYYGHIYIMEIDSPIISLVFYDTQQDDPTRLVLGKAGAVLLEERYKNVTEENTWYHYDKATDKYYKCSTQGEGSHPAFHKKFTLNYTGIQWLYGGAVPVYEGDKVYTAIADDGNECYAYNDGKKLEYGNGFTSVIVKIDGNSIYFCSDHTGDYGTFCDNCTPPCGLCTECGHPWAKHDPVGDCCSLCPVGDGCFDEILGEECVLKSGHDGEHDSWLPITNTDDINAILTKVVGEFRDAEEPDNYGVKISGNATDGFSYDYVNGGAKFNAVLKTVKQKGTEYSVEILGESGDPKSFTFVFDSQGKLTACYQAGYMIGGSGVSNYYAYPYTHVHTWNNGTCTLDGTTCSHTNMTTSDATCGTCGITNPSYVPPHTHNSSAYGTSATQHWTKCTDDNDNNGTPVNHTWSNGQCSVCNYTCQHSGGTATCTAAAVCSTCGASYGTALGHSFATEWSKDTTHHWHAATCGHTDQKSGYAQHSYTSETTTPATCTSAGVTTYTCTCGDTYTDTTAPAALGHNFTNYIPNNNATCTADGTKTATCGRTGCGVTDTITDEGTATGHSYATDWSKDATHHWHAATCGHTDQKSGYAQHSYTSEVTTPATCTSAGVTTYTCTCGATYTDTTAPAALGHSFTNYIPNNNATCTADGTKTATCGRTGCDVTDTITDEGTATGHSYATTWSSDENTHWYAATCEHTTLKSSEANHTYGETGTERYTCSVCSAVNEAKELQIAKAEAKAAIDAYVVDSESEDAHILADNAKMEIESAETVKDVNDIKDKALEDIKDIIAPDFATLAKDLKFDGTEVKLTKDYTRALGQEGITIKEGQKVVIDLNGHTIDGANDETVIVGCIFNVDEGAELVINDSTDNKGVITGGTGYDDQEGSRFGGAIYNNGTTTINDGVFTGNIATYGGAIRNHGTLTINGGVFTKNTANTEGGALDNCYRDSNKGKMVITGGTFTENSSKYYGGAIENYQAESLTIIGGTFTGNTATVNGGAIDNDGAPLYIGGSAVIKDNKVGENTNNVEVYGAIIVLDEETALTENAEIGITLNASTDTIIASGATLDTLKALKSDDASKMFIVEDGALKLQNIADHVHSFGETGEDRYNCQTCGVLDENEKAAVELADAKEDAKDELSAVFAGNEETAVLDVAVNYLMAIDNAKTIAEVDQIKAEGIKAILDAMHKHSYTSAVTTPATCTKDGVRTYTCSCGDTYTEPVAMIGHNYSSKVTKKATYTQAGVRTYTCANCGDTYTETIPRLEVNSAVKKNSTKMNAGLKVSTSTKDVTAKWGKVADADGYIVYANYCGKKYKAIKTIKNANTNAYSFTKLNGKKLDLNKNIKVYVVAYKVVDGKKVEFGKTIDAHVVGGLSRTYSNPTKVTVKDEKVALAMGKTSTIKATVTYKYEGKKAISDKHAAEKRYSSSNDAVATVDKNGKITAVGKGTCTIYVFAKNGYAAKVTVTVK